MPFYPFFQVSNKICDFAPFSENNKEIKFMQFQREGIGKNVIAQQNGKISLK